MERYFKKKSVLARINQGDPDTFLEVYNFYAPKLFRHIYYRVSSRETAEDLAQQVFYKVWRYLAEAEKKIDDLNAFLYRTANNLVVDYYRQAERKNIKIGEELERSLASETSDVEEIDRDFDLDRVKQALEKLSVEQKNLIIWRYLDDMSIDEIAKVSGKSKNAVYVGLHRALKELKKIMSVT